MRNRTGRLGMLAAGATLTTFGVVAAVVSGHGGAATAAGGDVIVVHGTDFPDPSRARLSLVGCTDMYDVAPETPQPMIGEGPGDAPVGARSLAYDLTGGNAIGPMFQVSSVASTTTASMSVHPWGVAATGVAYVAYQAPDDGETGDTGDESGDESSDDASADTGVGDDLFWLGRAAISAPGGVWSTVNVADHAFTWTEYDAATMQVVDHGPDQAQPIADFTDQHGGDGPGVFAFGFGCNGVPFNMDALHVTSSDGSTTYDLEGLTTSVAMSHHTALDGTVTLRGTLSSGNGDPLPGSTLRLEQADAAGGPWRTVSAYPVQGGVATATVQPGADTTWYRWEFVDRPLAAGSTSASYAVDGTGVEPTASPTATGTPTDTTTASPSGRPTETPTTDPSATDAATPSDPPSDRPSDRPSDLPSAAPSSSDPATPEPSHSATPSTSAGTPASTQPSAEPARTAGGEDASASSGSDGASNATP